MERPIEQMWNDFERRVVPVGAGPQQRRDLRRAFYGGAMVLFERMVTMLDPDAEPTEGDLRKMDEIHKELQAWLAGELRPSGRT